MKGNFKFAISNFKFQRTWQIIRGFFLESGIWNLELERIC